MKVILAASVLFFGAVFAFPQSEPTPAERARALRLASYTILSKNPHRVKITIERRSSEESPWELYSSMTEEVETPKRRRVVQHTGAKREYIYIDDLRYMRLPDGPWQLLSDSYTGPVARTIESSGETTFEEKRDSRGKVINSQSEMTVELLRTGDIVKTEGTGREWFDKDGRLIRTESEEFNHLTKTYSRRTHVYEYDPTIKVEAPINQ